MINFTVDSVEEFELSPSDSSNKQPDPPARPDQAVAQEMLFKDETELGGKKFRFKCFAKTPAVTQYS